MKRAFLWGRPGRSRLRPYDGISACTREIAGWAQPAAPVLVLLGSLLSAAPLAAQAPLPPTAPRFVEVTRLAQEGYGDSARAVIARLVKQIAPTDQAYPEALYTSAAVSATVAEARLLYARIVVDHPQSRWADKALLRLAQLDYGAGNSETAMLRVKRLFADYPESAVIPVASLFGARAAFERREGALACDWLTRGIQQVGSDLELKNQLEYARQRCTPEEIARLAALPKPDTTTRPTPPVTTAPTRPPVATTPAPAGRPAASPWRVQAAAITDAAAIRRTTQQLEDAGYTVYRVAGPNGLTKLQAGPFATRDAAVAAVAKVKGIVGGAPFVTRAP